MNISIRTLAISVVMALAMAISLVVVLAQSDAEVVDGFTSYETSDEMISFEYPTEWVVLDEAGTLSLVSNDTILEKSSVEDIEEGDLAISFFFVPQEMNEMLELEGESLDELASSFANVMLIDPEAEADDEVQDFEAELVEFGDEDMTEFGLVDLGDEVMDAYLIAFGSSNDVQSFALVTAYPGDFENMSDLVYQTLASFDINLNMDVVE